MNKNKLHRAKIICDQMYHCGDYGRCYYEPNTNNIILSLGDGDEPALTIVDLESEGFNVECICEDTPDEADDYILISRGIEEYMVDFETLECESKPILLSIEEYVRYYDFFNKLD